MTEETPQQKAIRDAIYVFARSVGLIWLVKKLPFITLRDHYQLRDNDFTRPRELQ